MIEVPGNITPHEITQFRGRDYKLETLRQLYGATLGRLMALENDGDNSRNSLAPCGDFLSKDVGGLIEDLGKEEKKAGKPMQVRMGEFLDTAAHGGRERLRNTAPQEDPSGGQIEIDSKQDRDLETLNAAVELAAKLMTAEYFEVPFLV